MSAFPSMPTAEESMEIAEKIYRIADRIASDQAWDAATDIEDWLTADGDVLQGQRRCWYLASLTPILGAALLKQLSGPGHAEVDRLPGAPASGSEVDARAAGDALVAHYNDRPESAQQMTTAHFQEFGYHGLLGFGLSGLALCGTLVRAMQADDAA